MTRTTRRTCWRRTPIHVGETVIRSITRRAGAVTLETGTDTAPEGRRMAPATPVPAGTDPPLGGSLLPPPPPPPLPPPAVLVVGGVVAVPVLPIGRAGTVGTETGSDGTVTVGSVGTRSARAVGMHIAAAAPSKAMAGKPAVRSANLS